MTILAIVLAFIVSVAPLTALIGTMANVATATDKVTTDVHKWRIDGCPQRQFNGTIRYLCAKPAPKPVAKKVAVPLPAPKPPVPYVDPPPSLDDTFKKIEDHLQRLDDELHPKAPENAPDLKLPVPDKGWTFDHLFAAFVGLIALGVIGHALRTVYRIWKYGE